MFSIDDIRAAIQSRPHGPAVFRPDPSHAGVAMVLAGDDNKLDACFIRRTERKGDPWSGQVAFPGGRASTQDRDAQGVAERETLEEIGLELKPDQLLGPLPVRSIRRDYIRGNLTLSPFVYHVDANSIIVDEVLQKVVDDVIMKVDAKEFPPKPGYLCKYCNFKTNCEFVQIIKKRN